MVKEADGTIKEEDDSSYTDGSIECDLPMSQLRSDLFIDFCMIL